MVRAQESATGRSAAEPVTSPVATGERVLLLTNGKVLKGTFRQTTTGYVVNVSGGQMVFPFEQVRLEAEDVEDAYRQLRDTLPEKSATAHVELARWCLANRLPDSARKELREALKIDPEFATAKTLLQRINDQLLSSKELPAVVARNGQYSMLGEPKLGVPAETLGGLPREAALEFVSKVQPLLVNRCATSGCHGAGSGNSLELIRTKLGKAPPKSHSERNLAAVLEQIDREQPLSSPLLVKLRGESKSSGVRQSHGGLSREQTQTLRTWVESIAHPRQSEAPASRDSESRGRVQASVEPSVASEADRGDDGDDDFFERVRRELKLDNAAPRPNSARESVGNDAATDR
jgi:hypothetical protein